MSYLPSYEIADLGIKLFTADFLDDELEIEPVDLTFTSPPYNLGIEYDGSDDNLSLDTYMAFTRLWLKKVYNLSNTSARLVVNIPFTLVKMGDFPLLHKFIETALSVGWSYKNIIVWQKISNSSLYGSFRSPRAPSICNDSEAVVVLYRSEWIKGEKVKTMSGREYALFCSNFWKINAESKKKIKHPAPFPVELAYRVFKLFSFPTDHLLDPFVGSGSSLLAAAQLKTKATGVELSAEYTNIATERLKNFDPNKQMNIFDFVEEEA